MQKYLLVALVALFTLTSAEEGEVGESMRRRNLKDLLRRITNARARIIRDIVNDEKRPEKRYKKPTLKQAKEDLMCDSDISSAESCLSEEEDVEQERDEEIEASAS